MYFVSMSDLYVKYEALNYQPASKVLQDLGVKTPKKAFDDTWDPTPFFKEYELNNKDVTIEGLDLSNYFYSPSTSSLDIETSNKVNPRMTTNSKGDIIVSSKDLQQSMDNLGLSNNKQDFLLKIAKLESSNTLNAHSNKSSASGLFQMVDSTRTSVSNVDKKTFLTSIDEQLKAASKLYDYNLSYIKRNNLLTDIQAKGMSINEAIALCWLNPSWAKAYITGKGNVGADANGTTPQKYLNKYRKA